MVPIPPPSDLNIEKNPKNVNCEPEDFLATFVAGHYLLWFGRTELPSHRSWGKGWRVGLRSEQDQDPGG